MAKRTGLQIKIAGIFRDTPIPKRNLQTNAGGPAPLPKSGDTLSSESPIKEKRTPEVKTLPVEESTPEPPKRDKPRKVRLSATRRRGSSTRKKTSTILAFVLSMTLISLLVRNFYASQENSFNPGVAVAKQAKTAISLKPIEINWPTPLVYPKDTRDPMELIKVKMPDIPAGIIVSIGNKLFVVIDRRLLSEGDNVDGVKVIRINRNTVEFGADGKEWAQETSRLAVRGIVYSYNNPLAVVGVDTVKEGDSVDGVTVIRINRNTVEFEVKGLKWVQEVESNGKDAQKK